MVLPVQVISYFLLYIGTTGDTVEMGHKIDFSQEIPQKFSRLPPLGTIFLNAPTPLT
jgi:hypothetical protein